MTQCQPMDALPAKCCGPTRQLEARHADLPPSPVVVEQRRGDCAESWHRGAAVVVDADQRIAWSIGQVNVPVLANSALKLLQVLPFIATGAADRWGCSDAEIVLAASSQSGRRFQRDALLAWLVRLGLEPPHVLCGPVEPHDRGARTALIQKNRKPTVFHNNCAGKHIGVLATCLHLGEPLAEYLEPDHPAQLRIRRATARLAGLDTALPPGPVDRCGMPSVALSLRDLALGYARLGSGHGLDADLAAAAGRLAAAIRSAPAYLVGPGRPSTLVSQVTKGRIVVKNGLEGVYAAFDTATARGYALKIDDGALRATDFAMMHLLAADGAFTPHERDALRSFLVAPVLGHNRLEVGHLAVTAALSQRRFALRG